MSLSDLIASYLNSYNLSVILFTTTVIINQMSIYSHIDKLSNVVTKYLHKQLPLSFQHYVRDAGGIRYLNDFAALTAGKHIILSDVLLQVIPIININIIILEHTSRTVVVGDGDDSCDLIITMIIILMMIQQAYRLHTRIALYLLLCIYY